MRKQSLAICLLAALVACQQTPTEPNPLDYDEIDVCFKATLAGVDWPEGATVGIVATCSRDGAEGALMSESPIARFKAGGDYLVPVSENDRVIARKGDHAFHFVAVYPYPEGNVDLKAIPLVVPATQDGTSDLNARLVSYGQTSALTVLPPVALTLSSPFSILTFNVSSNVLSGSSEKIKQIQVSNPSGALTQSVTLNAITGELSQTAGENQLTVDFGDGLDLSESSAAIQFLTAPFTIPEGGVQVSITEGDGAVTSLDALTSDKDNGKQIKAGEEYSTTLRTGGIATISKISSTDDWTAFAASIEEGNDYAGKTVTLTNDLIVSTFFAHANGTFKGTFDGDGHKMTANANKWPLFHTIGAEGTVKNLNVYGSFGEFAFPETAGNATIAMVNLGTIEDCVNYSSTDLKVESACIIGSLCAQNGGVVRGCVNKGNITVDFAAPVSKSNMYGGGISALGHTVTGNATETYLDNEGCVAGQFINCTNEGNIYVTSTTAIRPSRNALGGICGLVYLNGTVFDGCVNKGNISRLSEGEASNNGTSCLGGILGRSAAWHTGGNGDSSAIDNGDTNGYSTTYTNCSNSGTLMCKTRHSACITSANMTGARLDAAGGIVGAAIGHGSNVQRFTGCTNTGTISGGWALTVNTQVLGGIVGFARVAEIKDCTVNATFKSLAPDQPVGAAGGFVGFAKNDVNVSGSSSAKCTMDLYPRTSAPALLFYGLAMGNVQSEPCSIAASVSGSIKVSDADLGVTASNFKDFVVASISGYKPDLSNVTWAE